MRQEEDKTGGEGGGKSRWEKGKGQEDTPRQAKQILMWGLSAGVIRYFFFGFLGAVSVSWARIVSGSGIRP